jgi:hypothetical protein
MSNHFHLLLVVPEAGPAREMVGDEELLRRLRYLYDEPEWRSVSQTFRRLKETAPRAAEEMRRRYKRRMFDLSAFMKELKVRFSRWYNRRHGRKGTLWEERFRSVVIEGAEPDHHRAWGRSWEHPLSALWTVAAYIDLNPVRAGIVADPGRYRWSGYGAAVAGSASARAGISRAVGVGGGRDRVRWRDVRRVYRRLLAGDEEPAAPGGTRLGLRRERPSLASRLRYRVRYFTDGTAVGSREFLERLFVAHRERFGPRRRSGARKMRGGPWGGLMAMRDLGDAVVPPAADGYP